MSSILSTWWLMCAPGGFRWKQRDPVMHGVDSQQGLPSPIQSLTRALHHRRPEHLIPARRQGMQADVGKARAFPRHATESSGAHCGGSCNQLNRFFRSDPRMR